jgi:hypothetical protein
MKASLPSTPTLTLFKDKIIINFSHFWDYGNTYMSNLSANGDGLFVKIASHEKRRR